MLAKLNDSPRVVGSKETLRAVEGNKASKVFLAKDVDPSIKEKIQDAVESVDDIELEIVESKFKLGRACGIDVAAASAALLK